MRLLSVSTPDRLGWHFFFIWYEYKVAHIHQNVYSYVPVRTTTKDILPTLPHLTDEQKTILGKMLDQFDDLFDGTLGKWKGSDYKIELNVKSSAVQICTEMYISPIISDGYDLIQNFISLFQINSVLSL